MIRIPRRVSPLFCAAGLLAMWIAAPARAADPSPAGVWLTQNGDARIQVSRCGPAICGKVVWLRDPIDPQTGRPQTDQSNPNPALRSRPMIGVQLFIDMTPVAPNRWAGRIYNADDGKIYDSKITLLGPGALHVEGCVGLLCGGETWTRVGGR